MSSAVSSTGSGRPRVVCHMVASVDGRIVVDGWPLSPEERREYERVHASYEADGWLCGRVTMEPFAGRTRPETEVARQRPAGPPREDFTAPGPFDTYAFALDPSGRLAWESGEIQGDHVVSILSERVSDGYLAFLRERGVSYVFAGHDEIDLGLALERIGARFGVRTLMLEGGGATNGGMLRAGLIDELSLLVGPVADGRVGLAALFDDDEGGSNPHRLALQHVQRRGDNLLWLRYGVDGRCAPSTTSRRRQTRTMTIGKSNPASGVG